MNWRSAGITRFAPLASFAGEIDCNGFWNLTPPRTDKDGVWVPSQVDAAPTPTRRAQEPTANVGRCRVVELQPNTYPDAVYNLHRNDNNRLNPRGAGWVVRGRRTSPTTPTRCSCCGQTRRIRRPRPASPARWVPA